MDRKVLYVLIDYRTIQQFLFEGGGRRQNSVDVMAAYAAATNNDNTTINGLVSSRSENTMGIASIGYSNNGRQTNQRSSKVLLKTFTFLQYH